MQQPHLDYKEKYPLHDDKTRDKLSNMQHLMKITLFLLYTFFHLVMYTLL
jgi:hypothetical protein